MKKWTVIAGVVLAVATVAIVPMTVLAAPKDPAPGTTATFKGALAIEAPRKAAVGEKITIRVTERRTGDPVKDAGVWAVTKEVALAIKDKVAALREAGDAAALEVAVQSELSLHAIKIGETNGDGKIVNYAFERAGGYLLIAWKPGAGYFPGFRPILVTRRLMAIEAPFRARVGQEVTIKVNERGIGKPVEGAGVWAVPKAAIEGIKDKFATLKQSGDAAALESAVLADLDASGFRVGTTDNAGKVEDAFSQAGGYLLVTWKPGYFPAFRPILIVSAATTSNSAGLPSPNSAAVQ